jgi:hypothetical protein
MNLFLRFICAVEVHIFYTRLLRIRFFMIYSVQDETETLQNVPGCYPGCSSKTSDRGSWIGRWLLLTFLKRLGSPLQFSLLLTKWWRECRPGRGKNKRRQLYKFSAWEPHVAYKRSWTLQLLNTSAPFLHCYSFCSWETRNSRRFFFLLSLVLRIFFYTNSFQEQLVSVSSWCDFMNPVPGL